MIARRRRAMTPRGGSIQILRLGVSEAPLDRAQVRLWGQEEVKLPLSGFGVLLANTLWALCKMVMMISYRRSRRACSRSVYQDVLLLELPCGLGACACINYFNSLLPAGFIMLREGREAGK